MHRFLVTMKKKFHQPNTCMPWKILLYGLASDGMRATRFKRSLKHSLHLPRMSPHC